MVVGGESGYLWFEVPSWFHVLSVGEVGYSGVRYPAGYIPYPIPLEVEAFGTHTIGMLSCLFNEYADSIFRNVIGNGT